MVEIRKAILKENTDRALRKYGILVEIYKAAGFNALETYHDVLQNIWEVLKMLDDLWVTMIVSLYNSKWNKLWKLHKILTPFYRRKDLGASRLQQTHHSFRTETLRSGLSLQTK